MSEDAYSTLERHLAAFCAAATVEQIEHAAGLLRGVAEITPQALHHLATVFVAAPAQRQHFHALCVEAQRSMPGLRGPALALALTAVARERGEVRERMRIETVWTGPDHGEARHRKAAQALYDIIELSREDLLIVSFATYRVDSVIQRLEQALTRGVRVRLLLESSVGANATKGGGITASGFADIPGIEIWVWPDAKRTRDEAGRTGVLHAKCAIADERHALVTSANLTGHALHLNIELGLKIDGGDIPRRIARHFHALLTSGELERVK
jgi:phosphatidylserine/phosphatidylglycerophosphate/cardiolipin synthase-like enzyme